MRLLKAGYILSFAICVVIIGLGLLALFAGLATNEMGSVVAGVVACILGGGRALSTARAQKRLKQIDAMFAKDTGSDSAEVVALRARALRATTRWLVFFLVISLAVAGNGLFTLISALARGHSVAAGDVALGIVALVVGAVTAALIVWSMGRKDRVGVMRRARMLNVVLMTVNVAIMGLGITAIVWPLATESPDYAIGWVVIGCIVLLLGCNGLLLLVAGIRLNAQIRGWRARQTQQIA